VATPVALPSTGSGDGTDGRLGWLMTLVAGAGFALAAGAVAIRARRA